MIDYIYLGCPILLWEQINKKENENIIVIDQNKLYVDNAKIKLISISIFDISKILVLLRDVRLSRDFVVRPVADYCIEVALQIENHFKDKVFDYSFMASKKRTLKWLSENGIKCIQETSKSKSNFEETYILNSEFGHDSASIKKISQTKNKKISHNKLITIFVSGILINFDLFLSGNGIDYEIVDIYRRFNDSNFRTTFTKPNYNLNSSVHLINNLCAKVTTSLLGYRGELTVDAIVYRDNITVIEISPFFHKPWLRMISNTDKTCFYEHTAYNNQKLKLNKRNISRFHLKEFDNKNTLNSRKTSTLLFEK